MEILIFLTLLMIPGKEMSFFERVIVFGNLVSVSQEKMTAIRVNMFSLLIDGRPNQFIDFLENVSPGIRADLDENVSNARSLWINGRVSYSGVNSDGMFDFTALPAKANLIVPIDVATKSSDVLEFLATFKFESFTGIRASNLIPVVSQVTVKCKKVEGYSQQEHSAWASTVDDIEDVEIEILPGHAMIPALTEQGDLIYVPLMCVMCVAIPFVLVTIAPRFITAAEVNLFFLLETILGPLWVWMVIKEQPSNETIYGGIVIIITIAIHSLLAIKKTQTKIT